MQSVRRQIRENRRGFIYEERRLSKHFLLSDFMGCHSVYVDGKQNILLPTHRSKLREAEYLCETLLEPLLEEYGPLSISYGYLSPELSRQIVKYQDPDKPSYHRWDAGAAADVCIHAIADLADASPAIFAHCSIDDHEFPYSRMITYSESPYICLATKFSEKNGEPRKAFYENRYCGPGKKPLFIRKSAVPRIRHQQEQDAIVATANNWQGAGYPTYHGGGRLQVQHRRVSSFSMLSDFLYSQSAVDKGMRLTDQDISRLMPAFETAGQIYDDLLSALDVPRLSVAVGYQTPDVAYSRAYQWLDGHLAIELVPPEGASMQDLVDAANAHERVSHAFETAYGTAYIKGIYA